MKPGRELDALVAEKVMGFTPAVGPSGTRYGFVGGSHLPAYSTDIAAAWRLMDHFKGDEQHPMVRYDGKRPEGKPRWTAVVRTCRGDADTAPHAICLAALKAVE